MGSSWWNKVRKLAYKSTAYHCLACGVHKDNAKYHQWLEGHEVYKTDYKLGTLTFLYVAPLCHFCHNFIHDGRIENLLQQGKIHHHKYAAILKHGSEVLAKAKLVKPSRAERERKFLLAEARGEITPWENWRLIFEGKAYPPKFKSLEEWKQATFPELSEVKHFKSLAQFLNLEMPEE